jgi:hypothetical protein
MKVNKKLREKCQIWLFHTIRAQLNKGNIILELRKHQKWILLNTIGDKETATQVVDLLKEYDLFPRSFSEMKEIAGSLGAKKTWDI